MVKPDGKHPSKVQMDAQRLLHELLKASSHYDRIEYFGGVDKLGDASLVQKAASDKAAITRCIEILRDANSDDECAEAVGLVADILDTVEQARPLQ